MRKDSFKALVGSYNYNLNVPESDKDYKVFFYPSFDDLYSGKKYSKAKTSQTEDIEYHDIRKLPDMLWKSNVNFLEVLFSAEVTKYDELYSLLYPEREEIAKMNLPYLYDACMGMFYKKKKEFERDLLKGEWKKVYKHAMTAVRIIDFLCRYESTNWKFGQSIKYKNNDYMRDTLLNIRKGEYKTEIELRVFLDDSEQLLKTIKSTYKNEKEDLGVKEWLYRVVKLEVGDQIFIELQ